MQINDTVIHDDVIINDVISNSTLSAPPYIKKSGENAEADALLCVSLCDVCRYANLFLHPVREEDAPGYRDVILR